MRKLKVAWLWITHLFVFKRPVFLHLDYANCIVEQRSYLIFNWQIKNAYQLKIKAAKYGSFLQNGSAYIAIDPHLEKLTILISGSWHQSKHVLKLKCINLNQPIEFPATLKQCLEVKLKIPVPKQKGPNPKVNPFNISLNKKPVIKKIINISYPN